MTAADYAYGAGKKKRKRKRKMIDSCGIIPRVITYALSGWQPEAKRLDRDESFVDK
jgi:hypothetical protein